MTRNSGWIAALLVALGCGAGGDERIGSADEPIAGGQKDDGDTAVVAYRPRKNDLCGGVLVAPNAVLTARHCAAFYTGTNGGEVVCGKTVFTVAQKTVDMGVSFDGDALAATATWHGVSCVVFPDEPAAEELCGGDVALLILSENIAAAVAVPLVPRLANAPMPGEKYSAVGYGGIDDMSPPTSYGSRRRRDGLSVDCVGKSCKSTSVAAAEWRGDQGVCAGDSGGPALDAAGAVAGIVSRGFAGCATPIYSTLVDHAAWLKGAVAFAARAGGYAAPPWTAGASALQTPPGGAACVPPVADPGAPPPAKSCSCSVATPRDRWAAPWLVALALTACRRWRACSSDRSRPRRCLRGRCRNSARRTR